MSQLSKLCFRLFAAALPLATILLSDATFASSTPSCSLLNPTNATNGSWSMLTVAYSADADVAQQNFTRTSDVYLPSSYKIGQKIPSLMVLHGSGNDGQSFAAAQGFVEMAEKYTFLLLAPRGGISYRNGNGYTWNISFVPPFISDDVDQANSLHAYDEPYLGALLTEAAKHDCVNERAVFAFGFSGGARQASSLACLHDNSKQIAAFATASGLRAGPGDPSASPPGSEALTNVIESEPGRVPPNPKYPCAPSHDLGVISFQGTNDRVNPYDGDESERWGYSIDKATERWSSLLGCGAPSQERDTRQLTQHHEEHLVLHGKDEPQRHERRRHRALRDQGHGPCVA